MSYETDAYWADRARAVEEAMLTRIPENKVRPRLEPTRRAVELLGDPQKLYRVIHVTGTNGKTSTTRFIERLLREFGLKTGRFTSPHLVKLNERMSLDGEPVSDERLALVWEDIEPVLDIVDAELLAAGDTRLTFFEALAVLGFAIFADAPVDVLVLEVGMGGEWDSTNVADGDVAVFTPISLDHTERLGSTVAEIAKTKSGIIKPGALVVSSLQPTEALSAIQSKTAEVAESIKIYANDFEVIESEVTPIGQNLSVRGLAGEYHDLFIPVHGAYQTQNAAIALAAVEAFLGGGQQRIMDDIVRAAFADFSSPGRLQVIDRSPLTILDAAHNPDGARTLAHALRDTFGAPHTVAVISMLAEKDALNFFEALESSVAEVVITQSSSPRAVDATELAKVATDAFGQQRVHVEPSLEQAVALAKSLLPNPESGAVVVSGSITLVGDVLKIKQREDNEDG